ncbi:hypothetical protein ACJX0J_012651, partial [Zea mays]
MEDNKYLTYFLLLFIVYFYNYICDACWVGLFQRPDLLNFNLHLLDDNHFLIKSLSFIIIMFLGNGDNLRL